MDMKKTSFILAAFLAVLSCEKDEVIPPAIQRETPPEGTEKPTPEPEPEPEPPKWTDPLHQKEIPVDYRIPTVYIEAEGPIESKQEWVKAKFTFSDPSAFYSEQSSLAISGRIRGRGNTTWGMPKKPYRIKLDDDVAVFGRWSNKDWILLANYSDKTLLRKHPTCSAWKCT